MGVGHTAPALPQPQGARTKSSATSTVFAPDRTCGTLPRTFDTCMQACRKQGRQRYDNATSKFMKKEDQERATQNNSRLLVRGRAPQISVTGRKMLRRRRFIQKSVRSRVSFRALFGPKRVSFTERRRREVWWLSVDGGLTPGPNVHGIME